MKTLAKIYEEVFDELLTSPIKSKGIAYLAGDDKRLLLKCICGAIATALKECEPIKYSCGTCDGAKMLHHTLACMTVADYKEKVKEFLK